MSCFVILREGWRTSAEASACDLFPTDPEVIYSPSQLCGVAVHISTACASLQLGRRRDPPHRKPPLFGTELDQFNLQTLEAAPDPPPIDRAKARVLSTEVLVISGDRDAAAGVEGGKAVAHLFGNARHVILEGCGHYPWVDDPDAFVGAVEDFLTD